MATKKVISPSVDAPTIFRHDRVRLFMKLMAFLKESNGITDATQIATIARKTGLSDIIYSLALDEKNNVVTKFFRSILDQPIYHSQDYLRLRKLLINWYSSLRTITTAQGRAVNPFFLTSDELDEMIKSFGFPYPGYLIGRLNKVNFLYNLINFYQKKGSPHTFVGALEFFGFRDLVLSEWWAIQKPDGDIVFRSQPIFPRNKRNDTDYIREETYDEFLDGDVYWQLTEDQIKAGMLDQSIKLPSITPYINVEGTYSIRDVMGALSILAAKRKETYEYWIKYVLNPLTDVLNTATDASAIDGTAGNRYIISSGAVGAFSFHVNKIATATGTNWTYTAPEKNDTVYNANTSSHWIYNGTEWIDIETSLNTSDLGSMRAAAGNPTDINRDVVLNGFEGSYSFFEVMLAIDYLFNSSGSTPETGIYQYNGPLAPLDKGVYGTYGTSGTTTYRDDIDDQDYEPILFNYEQLTERPLTRDERDSRYSKFLSRFTGEISYTDANSFMVISENSTKFLSAMNANFKADIDRYIATSGRDTILSSIFTDFEFYLMRDLKILEVPITFLILGTPIERRLKDVVDFFKPLRVRVKDFTARIELGDPLGDSQLEKDILDQIITMYFGDKGPWELDQGLVTDQDRIQLDVRELIDDILGGRRGDEEIYYLDRTMKDEFVYELIQRFNDEWRDQNPDEFDITHLLYFGDSCPLSSYLDMSTITDNVEITVNEL